MFHDFSRNVEKGSAQCFMILAAFPINAATATGVHKSNFQVDRPSAAPPATAPWFCNISRVPRPTHITSNLRLTGGSFAHSLKQPPYEVLT